MPKAPIASAPISPAQWGLQHDPVQPQCGNPDRAHCQGCRPAPYFAHRAWRKPCRQEAARAQDADLCGLSAIILGSRCADLETVHVRNPEHRRTHLDHAFLGKFIDKISHADAVRWNAELTRSAGPGAANRAMEILKAMFGKAEAWGYLAEHSNPFHGVKRNRGRKIERFLSHDEMARLGRALAAHRDENPVEVAVVSLLAPAGCRRGEILNLTWGEVQGRKLKLTDSKTGPRIVWLGQKARAVLDAFPRGKRDQRVFTFDVLPRSALDWFWRRLRTEAGLDDVRLHDLRHNYASLAARSSETLPMIGNLLGHRHVSTTARYAHLDNGVLFEVATLVGQSIEGDIC
ncbi:MAG: site-specific integrase [Alteraurantiacibacter sp.]